MRRIPTMLVISFEKLLYPAALEISGACSITLVDQPIAIETIIAFLIDSFVTISLGKI